MKNAFIGITWLILTMVAFAQPEECVEPIAAPSKFGDKPIIHREFSGERHGFGEENIMGQKDPGAMVERLLDNPQLAERIGISKEKLAEIRKSFYDIRMKMIDLRAEMEKAGMEQARLMTEENVDEEALMKAVEKTGEIQTRMAKLRIQAMLQMKKALTPEQVAKLREIIAQRKKEMGRGENRPFLKEKMKERFGSNDEMKNKGEFRRRMPPPPPEEETERPLPPPPDDTEL